MAEKTEKKASVAKAKTAVNSNPSVKADEKVTKTSGSTTQTTTKADTAKVEVAKPAKAPVKKTTKKASVPAKKKPASKKKVVKASPKKAQKKTVKKVVKQSKVKKAPSKKAVKSQKETSLITTTQFENMETVMTQSKTQFDKLAKDAANESQKHAEAVAKAGNIFFKGAEDYLKTYATFAQKSAEKSQEAVKAILGCKTLNEFTETQNKLAQESFDDFMNGFTKLSEISVKVATDAFEPINDQLSKSIKKATDSLAA